MKICVIGAGISGLSIAQLLKDHFEVEVLESDSTIGGIAKTKKVEGITYHTIGGHCFNSKHQDVLDFVFSDILKKDEWHLVERDAKILFKDNMISYPIEFAVKEIDSFDTELAFNISKEILSASGEEGSNLEEWFINHFGPTLARDYFVPYNKKIWQMEPKNMDSVWVKDKLPIPSKYDFYKALIKENKDEMPHAKFYYPNTNDQMTFLNALASGLNIKLNYKVETIEKSSSGWIVNGEKEFGLIINTSPLDRLGGMLADVPADVKTAFNKLRYNRVSNVLWKTDKELHNTWTYLPSDKFRIHRIINIGSFFDPKEKYCITEIMGENPYETFIEEGKKLDYLITPLDYNVSDHAYVVFDSNYKSAISTIYNYLKQEGLYTHGRFGEWEYYNMDICIKKSLELSGKILSQR